MVLQVKHDIQSGPEDRLPQLSNQRPQESENAPRNQIPMRNEGGNGHVHTDQRLPDYFLYGDTTSRIGPGPRHVDGRTDDISQRTVSSVHDRTVLLEDTGKELRKMADMYMVTRNTGHELRRIADAIYYKLSRPECHPPDLDLITEVTEVTEDDVRRRKNS